MVYTNVQKLVTRRERLARLKKRIESNLKEKEVLIADIARLEGESMPTGKDIDTEEQKLMSKLAHIRAMKGITENAE